MYKKIMFVLCFGCFTACGLNACRPYWFYYGEQHKQDKKREQPRPATQPQYPGHGFVPHVGPSTPATK